MTLPSLPDLTAPHDDLAAVRERLVAVRASLQKACLELDAQIQALDSISLPVMPVKSVKPGLFESEPVPPVTISAAAAMANWKEQPTTQIILKATGPSAVDPKLEQATLEELNSALSKAFSQISNRHPWAG